MAESRSGFKRRLQSRLATHSSLQGVDGEAVAAEAQATVRAGRIERLDRSSGRRLSPSAITVGAVLPSGFFIFILTAVALVAVLLTTSTGHAQGFQEPAPTIDVDSQPDTAEEFLALLRGAGFDDIPVREIAVSRDWIPNAFSPHYVVGGATLEIFELSGTAAVEEAMNNLAANGGAIEPAPNETIWDPGSLIVILLDAGGHPDVERSIVGLIGPPALTTAVEPPPPAAGDDAPGSLADLIPSLQAVGLDNIAVATTFLPVTRDWIPVPAASLLLIDGAELEVYELGSAAAVAAALDSFQDGSGVTAPPNATIWGPGSLILILLSAPAHPDLEAAIADAVGSPAIATIMGSPPPPPPPVGGPGEGAPLVATSVEALADALRLAGLDVLVTNTVVSQPWIPKSGVHLVVEGAGLDVFVLSSQDAVSGATATRKNGPVGVQPPANVAVWLNGTAFMILLDAPQHSAVSEALSALIGPPQFTTIAGPQPPLPPAALPSTGTGGFDAASDGGSHEIWGIVAASLLLFAAFGYGVKSRWRGRFRSRVSAGKHG